MQHLNRRRSTSGFSLVELLLALMLGLLVVTGIVQLFISNSQTYQVLNAQARMQENARFALDFITRAARSAGYLGCALDRSNYVNGLGGEWENIPGREFDVTQIIQADADSIRFRGIRGEGQRLTEVLQPDGNPRITAPGGDPGFAAGDEVVLADCEQGAVFRVAGLNAVGADEVEVLHAPAPPGGCAGSVYTAAGNAECVIGLDSGTFVPYSLSKLNRSYGEDAVVGLLENVTFFVAPGAGGGNALWQDVNGTANEVVSNVDALDVWFGLDVQNDDERQAGQYVRYADLPDPTDLSEVVALRVRVTVNSGDAVDADGNVLRRAVGKTILLRNSNSEA